jgi:hypothetical protein
MTAQTKIPTRLLDLRRPAVIAALLCVLLLGATLPDSSASEPAPLVQQGAKLVESEESGPARFGRSVVLSADGNTALIGAPRDSNEAGAVWVFTRSGSTWTQRASLTGEGESGEGHFGRGLALSADGDTALIGAPNDSGGGAVWVFTRSGSTWTQQAKLAGEGESGSGWFGQSVALSADGDTALVGGYVDHSDAGAAWVFTRSGTTWTQQGAKLTGAEESGEGEFGWSVALSGDGETALIGGHEDDGGVGAVWVFTRSGESWSQQGSKLVGGGESGAGEFGQSVALSADGETALIGGREDGGGVGAAWVLTRSGSIWMQRGSKLAGGEEVGKGQFGWSVALSADGDTALIGGLGDDGYAGAAWAFGDPPPASLEVPPGNATPPTADSPSTTTSTTPTTTSTTAKQGLAAFRVAAGRVSLIGSTITVRGSGRAIVKLKCIAAVTCRGRLKLTVRRKGGKGRLRTSTIAMGAFSLPPAKTVNVKFELSALGRSLMSVGHGRLRAALMIRKSSPGPTQTRTDSVHLVLRTAAKHTGPRSARAAD